MKKLIDYKLFEYSTSLSEEELMEMSNVTSNETGIENIVLWIGPNPQTHGYRIKVSNIPNKISSESLFVITIPELEIIGNVNKKFITKSKIEKIKEFIIKNMQVIMDYSDYKISTKQLLDNLIKV
jgi:hypothetical protein